MEQSKAEKKQKKAKQAKAEKGKAVSQKPKVQYVQVPAKLEGMRMSTQLALRNMLMNEDNTPCRWPTDINAPTACMQNKDALDASFSPVVDGNTINTLGARGEFMVHTLPVLRKGIRLTASAAATIDTSASQLYAETTTPASMSAGQVYWFNSPIETNVSSRVLYSNGVTMASTQADHPGLGNVNPFYFLGHQTAPGTAGAETLYYLDFFPAIPASTTVTFWITHFNPAINSWKYQSVALPATSLAAGIGIGNGGIWDFLETCTAYAVMLDINWSGQLSMSFLTKTVSSDNNGILVMPQCTYNCSAYDRQNFQRLYADGVHLYRCTALTTRVTCNTPALNEGGVGDSYLLTTVNRMGYYTSLQKYISGRYPYARVGFNAKTGDYKYWLPFDSRSGIFRGLSLSLCQDRSIIQIFQLPDRANQSFRVTTVMDVEFISDAPGYSYALASPDPDFWSGVMLLASLDNCNENPTHMERLKNAFKKVLGVASNPKTWERLGKAATVAAGLLV